MQKKVTIIILLLVIFLGISLAPFLKKYIVFESFSNFNLSSPGSYPSMDTLPLLTDSYPYTGRKTVSNENSSTNWWYFPIFTEGSYAQITNNLRYRRNPDDGECSRAEFCGALYKEKENKSNYIYPLPEAQTGVGARVNYYRTEPNLLFQSISTNENILY